MAVAPEDEDVPTLDGPISEAELQDVIDRHGEDPENWPEIYRDYAALLRERAELRAIVEEARALRAALHRLGTEAPACLSERIVTLALEIDPPAREIDPLPDDGVVLYPRGGRC